MKSIKQFFTWLFFPVILLFKKKQPKIKAKIEEVTQSYDELIAEYRLIQEKKSKLSLSERLEVINRINHLVSKGHIKAS
jgi:hypothetical protein